MKYFSILALFAICSESALAIVMTLVTSWQWQLTTPVDQSVKADMYDIDLFENSANVVASLKAKGQTILEEDETKLLNEIKDRYDRQTSPYYAAARLWVDEIIDPVLHGVALVVYRFILHE